MLFCATMEKAASTRTHHDLGKGREPGKKLLCQLLGEGLAVEVRVTGSSMSPMLRSGDVVTLAPARRPLRTGDVAAFLRQGRQLVVHRLVGRRGELLEPRGDAAPAADEPVAPAHILGRVERITRAGRRIRFGLGPERRMLAWLSRHGWLHRLLVSAARWAPEGRSWARRAAGRAVR